MRQRKPIAKKVASATSGEVKKFFSPADTKVFNALKELNINVREYLKLQSIRKDMRLLNNNNLSRSLGI